VVCSEQQGKECHGDNGAAAAAGHDASPRTGLRPTLLLLAAAGEDVTPLLKAARARLTVDQDAVVLPLRPARGEAL
jgi:hypothetical protein